MLNTMRVALLSLSLIIILALYPLLQPMAKTGAELIRATALFTLYNGSLGNLPADQGFFVYLTQPFPPSSATQTATSNGVILDSMAVTSDYAGYVRDPDQMPTVLNRTTGYTVNFTVQITSESHTNSDTNSDGIDDRAGFSVTVLSDDSDGIELGFWTNQIWAQDDDTTGALLTHAEGVTFTTTSLTPYSLAIRTNIYTLSANGTPILSGSLRNYSAFVPPFPGVPNPYTSTNFISLGDNSSSARAKIKLALVSVNTNAISLYLPLILKGN